MTGVPVLISSLATSAPGCEPLSSGALKEPVAAVTSLAFVLAALVIPAAARHGDRAAGSAAPDGNARAPVVRTYAVLCAGIGIGSVVQHGPDPSWSEVAHGLPLAGMLAFVAADALADLSGRARALWWWVVPTAGVIPLLIAAPRTADAAQAALAAIAILATLARARARNRLRRRVALALALLALGAAIGTLSRAGGPLCAPESIWQGHAFWHVLASAALVVLAPVIGSRRAP